MTEHEIAELLPFYVNGTLDAGDRARVDDELGRCAACAAELRELQSLGAALLTRAAAAHPVPPGVFDDALARIASAPGAHVATRLSTAWWGMPARYATAAALVFGLGAAGMAAWHAREAQFDHATTGTAVTDRLATTIFRVTPGPNAPAAQRAKSAGAPLPAAAVAKQPRLARKARLELLVGDVEAVLRRAEGVVRDAGGDVTALDDRSPHSAGAVHGATLEVEVPAAQLEPALERLARLGTVQNRAIDAEDVAATIVDEEARLRNLRRAETDLRTLMDKGGKVDDILTVQQNLAEVRGQIEQLDAQHAHDVHRVATSTIAVALVEDRPDATPAKPGPSARIDGAWHAGVNALIDTAVALLSAAAWCLAYSPIPLAAAGLVVVARYARMFGSSASRKPSPR